MDCAKCAQREAIGGASEGVVLTIQGILRPRLMQYDAITLQVCICQCEYENEFKKEHSLFLFSLYILTSWENELCKS